MKFDESSLYNIESDLDGSRRSLFDLAIWKNGLAFKKIDFSKIGRPVIKIAELNNGINSNTSFTQGDYGEEVFIRWDDLLFAWSGNPKTSIDVFRYRLQDGWLNQHIFKVTANGKFVTQDFLYYVLKFLKPHFTEIAKNKQTTGLGHVTIADLKRMSLVIPSKKVQGQVVSILKAIDDKIEVNTSINKNLLQQAQAMYKSWFIDYEPFDGDRPADWIIGTIDDLAKEVVCGKTPSTKVKEYYGSGVPFITIPDMHGNTYAVTTERYLSNYGAASQAKKTLPPNSVCVSCIGTAGLVTLVASESQTNQQINSIIPKDEYSPFYIFLLMQALSEVINKLGQSGSTIVNLNKAQFGKIKVTVPSVSNMKTFDATVAPLFALILANQKENIHLSSVRETLLPRLMSGELDVSDIDL